MSAVILARSSVVDLRPMAQDRVRRVAAVMTAIKLVASKKRKTDARKERLRATIT